MMYARFQNDVTTYAHDFMYSSDFDADYRYEFACTGKFATGTPHILMLFIGYLATDGYDGLLEVSDIKID